MAEKMGVSKSYIAVVESGKQLPSFDYLIKLCTTHNISADYLLFNSGNMFRENNEFLSNIDPDWLEALKNIEAFNIDTKIALMKLILAALESIEASKK